MSSLILVSQPGGRCGAWTRFDVPTSSEGLAA